MSECLADNLYDGSSLTLCSLQSLRSEICFLDAGEVVTCVLIVSLIICVFSSFFSGLIVNLFCHTKRKIFSI